MSVKIIAVSHGRFSEGLVDSVQMLAGEQKDLVYYGLFPEETVDDLREKLRAELEATPEDMEVLFLSDVFHGSPFNTIVDDEVANDSFNKRVIKALAPNGVKCNVYSVEKGADITLGILAENDGRFPDSAFSKGEFQKRDHRLSPELPEVRSFLRTVRGKNFCPGNRRMRILLYC